MKTTNSQTPTRRFLVASLVLVVVAFPGLLQAQFAYLITTNLAVTITGYTGPGGTLAIPSTISGLPVAGIGHAAFQFSGLTNITLPYTLTNTIVGADAFQNCRSLLNINVDLNNPYYSSLGGVLFDKSQRTLVIYPYAKAGDYSIPATVTDIGQSAFDSCGLLSSVTIPNSVTVIGIGAFAGSGLTNASIGTNVVTIADDAFFSCGRLSSITVPNGVTAIGNYSFANCGGLTNIIIPSSVRAIWNYAFANCAGLRSITIANGVTGFGVNSFYGCTGLTSVTLPNSVINPGDSTFYGCSGLTNATINGFQIGNNEFAYCTGLTSVTIGSSVTNIADNAFLNCGRLTSVIIPDNVINLGSDAFAVCSGLTHVTIGSGITNIADGTFASCTSLTGITIPNTVTSMGASVFGGCTSLSSISIPDSIGPNLGPWTFQYCSNLTDVVIGSGVTNIWDLTFADCPRLNNVYFRGNAPSANDPFVFLRDDVSIIHYLPWTTGWGPVFANRPAIPWLPQIVTGDSNFGVKNLAFGFNVFWASGINVVVEGSTDLAKSVWVPLATDNLITGSFYFADPQWTNYPARYYRVHSL
jgi:hypothetical protein